MHLFGTTRSPRHIVFGAGQRFALPQYARMLGSRVQICTDERLASDPQFLALFAGLEDAGMRVKVFAGSLPEVPTGAIEASVRCGKEFEPDVIVGIGGGSCLDMAKVTALLLSHGGVPGDYYGEFKVPGPVVPLIALPTTAGTGSEVTPVAVLTDPERTLKVGISSPELIPMVAICDPELSHGAPRTLTAHSGADALTHAIESFTAIAREPGADLTRKAVFVGKNVLSDVESIEAARLIAGNLERVVANGADADAREAMMLGALFAGMSFGSAGNAAAHALQYPLGALTHTSHGVGVACLMPYVMEYNLPVRVAAFARLAEAMGVRERGSEEALAMAAIDLVADLFRRVEIPLTVRELGLAEDKIGWAAEQAMASARLVNNNPRPLDVAAMTRILAAAWQGDRSKLSNDI